MDTTTHPLTAHIQAKNAETLAWVAESPTTRCACTLVEDAAHWEVYGIHTPAEFDHYMLATNVYESTKSIWGYKPNWTDLMKRTDEELESMLKQLEQDAIDAKDDYRY